MKESIIKSSGNVFRDLGFTGAEAESLSIRSRLMYEIGEYIKKEELTQVQAADLMGVKQPRISNLINGKIELFTIDMLITMLAKAGLKVEITLKDAA